MGGQGRTGVAGYRISGQGIAHRELRNSMAANRERERYVFRSTERSHDRSLSLSFCINVTSNILLLILNIEH